ncbi:OpgC domain-containing protein [Azohydromonas australica]|uniref:OpgC domain-containing protein n=1 Tax=Azohydromonas australica TaxID=364039 RepID=UPI00040F8069|nr:OpgC domain-containing protein [Azohydromonas australica]
MNAPSVLAPPATISGRQWEIDALRGLMLVLMTLTHLPTRYATPMSQPFGFVSAAEGFVFLSALVAAKVYTARQRREGDEALTRGFHGRALKLWAVQGALLVALFTLIALLGLLMDQPAVTDLLSFYLERPLVAFVAGLMLIYNPPLLDILPLYILFMLASPLLLLSGGRRGWVLVLGASAALWAAAQADVGTHLYEAAAHWARIPVPARETGAFELLGWQFLWVLGLWMGARAAHGQPVLPALPPWVFRAAAGFALVALLWRHAAGQVPWPGAQGGFPALVNAAFDKWHLGPLRLLNLVALVLLLLRYGPALAARMPRPHVLELLGRASLPVFVAHLLLVLLALAFFGTAHDGRSWWVDSGLLAGAFAVLYAVAQASAAIDRHGAEVKARLKVRRERRRQARAEVQR